MVLRDDTAPNAEPRIVNRDSKHPKANLVAPNQLGYLYVGAAIAPGPLPFVLPNARRKQVLRKAKALAAELASSSGVVDATIFRAIAIPPTTAFSAFLKARRATIPIATFDVIALVRTTSIDEAKKIQASAAFCNLVDALRADAQRNFVIAARNVRRIADVDTSTQGLFLFNHFASANPDLMLKLWDYLAGWYVMETGLRNSVALAPLPDERNDYAIINWARWDSNPIAHFAGMLSKPSFWNYVTANLDGNDAAAMPVYCRLA